VFDVAVERKESLTDGGDGGDDLSKLELVEDGGLSGGVKSDHEDAHLLLAEETRDCGVVVGSFTFGVG
jgi:hypothetical protein